MSEQEQQRIFNEWIARHKALVFKIVRAYAFTAIDQDDLFQEIAIQIWRSVPAFRGESAVTTWLYRIALNTAIKWVRQERRHYDTREPLESAQYFLQDNKVLTDERLTWLYEEIAKLDEIDKSITLLMLEGFSYKEMSDILGITDTNVGVKINRIKKHLIVQSKKYDHGI